MVAKAAPEARNVNMIAGLLIKCNKPLLILQVS
jgi:hypothetical protein